MRASPPEALCSRQSSCEDKQSTSKKGLYFIIEAACMLALLPWWQYFPNNSCFPAVLHLDLSCLPRVKMKLIHNLCFKSQKANTLSDNEPRNVTDCVWKGKRGRKVINNTGEVRVQAGEGCPALRKADRPSSQAYSCHSTLTCTHRAREQVGFKRNKLPKYGSEKAFERSSIGNRWKW